MSVIQDALRRKLDEQRSREANGERPQPRSAPPQAPPVAQQVIQNEARPARRSRPAQTWDRPAERPARGSHVRDDQRTVQLLLGLILLMLIAAFIGAVLYFLDARNPPVQTQPVAPSVQAPVAPAAQPVAPSAPGTAPAPTAVQPQVVNVPPAPAVAPAPAAASAQPAAPAATPDPVLSSPAAPPPVTPAGWPVIEVGGVLAGATAKGSSAILNGEWVRVRQKVDGVRLTAVSNEGVTLEYRGETRFVETGTSTEDEE